MNKRDFILGVSLSMNVVLYLAGHVFRKGYEKEKAQYKKLWSVTNYVARMVEKAGIELDEFDLIVFHELGLVEQIEEETDDLQ